MRSKNAVIRNATKEFKWMLKLPSHQLKMSLWMCSGEFIIIVGRSGTGKTTFLNLAAGL